MTDTTAPGGAGAAEALPHVLLALVVIIIAARALGFIFRRLKQPPVIGEVLAGIVLGPSVLGALAPGVSAFLLPPAVEPHLQVLAQVGVILYMFLVGLEFDTDHLRHKPHAAVFISQASIAVPFALGAILSLVLYPRVSSGEVPFSTFALFLGVSLSVTAFPVLARILGDHGLQRSRLGVLALTCAAVGDVVAWLLLAFIVGLAEAQGRSVVVTAAQTAGFVGVLFLALRPLLVRAVRRVDAQPGRTSGDAMAAIFVLLLASALCTEWIGIHALFGAFLLGVVIPDGSRVARDMKERLESVVVVLLLPAFFAFSGLRTRIQLLSGAEAWLLCALIVSVACLGKFGGSSLAARLSGLGWRDACALGVLMNTRGLVELIVLNVGLDLGVISPTLFAMLVVMALVTTFATSPLLDWITRAGARAEARLPRGDPAPAGAD